MCVCREREVPTTARARCQWLQRRGALPFIMYTHPPAVLVLTPQTIPLAALPPARHLTPSTARRTSACAPLGRPGRRTRSTQFRAAPRAGTTAAVSHRSCRATCRAGRLLRPLTTPATRTLHWPLRARARQQPAAARGRRSTRRVAAPPRPSYRRQSSRPSAPRNRGAWSGTARRPQTRHGRQPLPRSWLPTRATPRQARPSRQPPTAPAPQRTPQPRLAAPRWPARPTPAPLQAASRERVAAPRRGAAARSRGLAPQSAPPARATAPRHTPAAARASTS
mmetsp:Transcript_4458/g.14328  ORF Transcript_4458/g.14328 Transcript_4458/m.14328 type:complete len:280 (-) Transcript_4458:413-1252(-)